jgi:hypothetical protein
VSASTSSLVSCRLFILRLKQRSLRWAATVRWWMLYFVARFEIDYPSL